MEVWSVTEQSTGDWTSDKGGDADEDERQTHSNTDLAYVTCEANLHGR